MSGKTDKKNLNSKPIEIILSDKNLVNPNTQNKRLLFRDKKPDIDTESFRVFIGNRPVIRDLRELAEKTGKSLPVYLQGLEQNKLLLMEMTVGVWKEGGMRRLSEIGFEVSYPSDPYVTVRDILPQSRYVKKIGGKFSCNVGISINGEFCSPTEEILTEIFETIIPQLNLPSLNVLPEVNIKASGAGEIVGNFSFSVGTKFIDAIGTNDDYCAWRLKEESEPLPGKPHLFFQILLVPKNLFELKLKCRASVTTKFLKTFPQLYKSNWKWINCPIPRLRKS